MYRVAVHKERLVILRHTEASVRATTGLPARAGASTHGMNLRCYTWPPRLWLPPLLLVLLLPPLPSSSDEDDGGSSESSRGGRGTRPASAASASVSCGDAHTQVAKNPEHGVGWQARVRVRSSQQHSVGHMRSQHSQSYAQSFIVLQNRNARCRHPSTARPGPHLPVGVARAVVHVVPMVDRHHPAACSGVGALSNKVVPAARQQVEQVVVRSCTRLLERAPVATS